ncbi:MAG: sirohydrochlorin cobaltochelatase [Deltaproteobacteria bacterium]|jgi:sirohydrochlorin cobaltochelatase|nr:sirohydrochlorin cobaltochelatase [Deltaproteobacteria bacterium]
MMLVLDETLNIIIFLIVFFLTFFFMFSKRGRALAYELPPRKPSIVLAAFGTTVPEALVDLENIMARVSRAFPGFDIRLSFTSNMIRRVWRERAADGGSQFDQAVLRKYTAVKNPLSVLADIQEEGAGAVLVQSLHVTDGEEYHNLALLIQALANQNTLQKSLKPFPCLKLGAPALGLGDGDPKCLDRAVLALSPLLEESKEKEAALVMMGHGNERLTQSVFQKLQARLRLDYPRVYLGTVEARPFGPQVAQQVAIDRPPSGQVIMAPLMVVAGDHARNDMAGSEPDSWQTLLSAQGFEVEVRLSGLGSLDSWADIYVENLNELYREIGSDQPELIL